MCSGSTQKLQGVPWKKKKEHNGNRNSADHENTSKQKKVKKTHTEDNQNNTRKKKKDSKKKNRLSCRQKTLKKTKTQARGVPFLSDQKPKQKQKAQEIQSRTNTVFLTNPFGIRSRIKS